MKRFDPRRLLFDREVLGLMGLGLLVKPIGLFNQVLIARYFGAGESLDAYALAFFLVTFGDGTLSRVFKASMAPHLIKLKRVLDADTYARYQNGVVGLFLGAGAAWLVILAALAPAVVALVGPSLPANTSALAARMCLIMAVPGLLLVANNLGISLLQLHQYFRVAGAMPVVNSLAMLGSLLLWHDRLGIWALPLGFAISQLLQWPLIQGRALLVRAWRPLQPALRSRDLVQVRALAGLVLISQVLLTVNVFLDKWFATGLVPGSISSIHYALTLTNFGVMLFATSLVTVMYPRMSEAIANGDLEGCSEYIRGNLVRLANLVVPSALVVALAAPEIVRILFQRGAFDAADALRTSGAMTMYMLGLPALIINGLVARIYHSLQLLRDKVWLSVQYLGTNALLNVLLVGPMQVRGLALASTVAINLHLLLSLWLLHRRRSGLYSGEFLFVVGRAYVMGLLAAVVYWWLPTEVWLGRIDSAGMLGAGMIVLAKAAVIFGVYGVLVLVWRRRAAS